MDLPTGEVPESYKIYFDLFEEDPQGTIKKLENHVTRRNSGAVGYFFLAVLCRKAGNNAAAVKFALSAKILAPGSKFFSQLPYYIQHPDLFNAWVPSTNLPSFQPAPRKTQSSHPIEDLDQLITKLSGVESKRIRLSEDDAEKRDLSESSANVDDIVTETLALIHEKQKNYTAAISVYQQLKLANSSKKEVYDEKILRLQQLADSRKKN